MKAKSAIAAIFVLAIITMIWPVAIATIFAFVLCVKVAMRTIREHREYVKRREFRSLIHRITINNY